MPIQTEVNSFVNFIYKPDYLQNNAGLKTISDVQLILKNIGITATNVDVVLDGGNVVEGINSVILCDKGFKENPQYDERKLIKKLKEVFQVDRIIILPTHKSDFTGHADGLVRFVNDNTALINGYAKEDRAFHLAVMIALNNAGLETLEMPYNPYNNSSNDDACGIYINYLEMDGFLIIPTFGIKEDNEALQLMEELYPNKRVLTINSTEIAKKGGILIVLVGILKFN